MAWPGRGGETGGGGKDFNLLHLLSPQAASSLDSLLPPSGVLVPSWLPGNVGGGQGEGGCLSQGPQLITSDFPILSRQEEKPRLATLGAHQLLKV